MTVGILKETKVKEYRVALDDSQVARLVSAGIKVFVEKGAGWVLELQITTTSEQELRCLKVLRI